MHYFTPFRILRTQNNPQMILIVYADNLSISIVYGIIKTILIDYR